MDPMVVQYALFILVALLLSGAVIALNRWLYRQSNFRSGPPNTWVKLDARRPEIREEALPGPQVDEDGEEEEAEIHVRASQNGHHSDGQKPQI
jgi:hypothetical protein